MQNGEERVIAYYSQTHSRAERQYCTTRKELLAVIKAVRHFHVYLYGRHFTIRTDHAALQWLLKFRFPEGQVARWLHQLQQYDFNIEHRAGRKHQNADALSRRPCLAQLCKHCDRLEGKERMTIPQGDTTEGRMNHFHTAITRLEITSPVQVDVQRAEEDPATGPLLVERERNGPLDVRPSARRGP